VDQKIMTIIGARPQFIKAAVVSRAFAQKSNLREIIVHTGQHFDAQMSDVFFREMEIPAPSYNLRIDSLGHGAMTGRMMEKLEDILLKELPDYVLVYGDTNTTLAGALAARKNNLKLVHIEAGLRSFNMKMPEEINRIVTDRISDILFCPTQTAVDNLRKEGFDNFKCNIAQVGDVMYDAALYYSQKTGGPDGIMNRKKLAEGSFVLATIHRAENTDDLERLKNIIQILNEIAKEMMVVLPLHPRTRKILASQDFKIDFDVVDPVGYFDMLELLKNARLILTDSGGVQKEAYFFDKYCITLRDQTEWIELVNNQYNWIVGTDVKLALDVFHKIKNAKFNRSSALYGNGDAAIKIADYLADR